MTPEGKVKEKIKALLRQYGCYYTMPATYGLGRSGGPDFVVCCNGRFLGVEAKAKNGKPTLLQIKHLQEIADAGGVALVINEDNLHELERRLQEACEGSARRGGDTETDA